LHKSIEVANQLNRPTETEQLLLTEWLDEWCYIFKMVM